jgi:hypothetical protein
MLEKWTLILANVSGIFQNHIRRFFQNLLIEKEPTPKVLSKPENRTTRVSTLKRRANKQTGENKKNGYG